MSSLSEPEPSPSSSSPSSPYALIDTLAEYGIPIIDLCLIIESFLTPADIWYRCLFEGWRVPPTSDSTADEYLLCFAEEGGDVELDQAIAWGATRLEDALRIAAKHNQQRVAAVLVERGVLRTYQNQLTIALSKEVGCAELRCELGKIDAWCRDKIRNTLLFFRWKWLNDDAFRGIYCTEEVREWLDENEELASAAPDVRGGREATLVWKDWLLPDRKTEARALYQEWLKKLHASPLYQWCEGSHAGPETPLAEA